MRKLFELKRWLTMQEAAKHIALSFNDDISEADILRLVLDNRLKLSVVFVNETYASFCDVKEHGQLEYENTRLSLEGKFMGGTVAGSLFFIDNSSIIQSRKTVHNLVLDEPYELTMAGGERPLVQRRYHSLIGGPVIDNQIHGGALLFRENMYYELKKIYREAENDGPHSFSSGDFRPYADFTENAILVITTPAILEFEQSMLEKNIEKPLQKRERDTLLAIIGVLCLEAKLDYRTHAKTAAILQGAAAGLGISIGETTIEGHLKKVTEAMGGRSK